MYALCYKYVTDYVANIELSAIDLGKNMSVSYTLTIKNCQ